MAKNRNCLLSLMKEKNKLKQQPDNLFVVCLFVLPISKCLKMMGYN